MVDLRGKRVLVLGGSLFMGPPTIEHLLDAGCAVTVMNRGVSTPATDFGSRVTTVKCDRKSDDFAKFLSDAVVHFPAVHSPEVQHRKVAR
jgi:nucleoside-diphosphate-sugar epimerase